MIFQPGCIGDMILTTPMFRAIKEKFPESELLVLCGGRNYPVIKGNPRIDRILINDKSPLKLMKTVAELRKANLDYLIDHRDHFSSESKYVAQITKAITKIGFNRDGKGPFDVEIPSDVENYELHYVERCFNSLEPLGIERPANIPKPELFEDTHSAVYVENFVATEIDTKFILINISASKPDKIWPSEKWIEFINKIDFSKIDAALTFAPSELASAEEIAKNCSKLRIFRSRSINDVISLAKRSEIIVTPDTSVVHIAAAFDKPLIGIFAAVEKMYRKFYPLSSEKIVIRAEKETPEVASVPVEKVIAAANGFGIPIV